MCTRLLTRFLNDYFQKLNLICLVGFCVFNVFDAQSLDTALKFALQGDVVFPLFDTFTRLSSSQEHDEASFLLILLALGQFVNLHFAFKVWLDDLSLFAH